MPHFIRLVTFTEKGISDPLLSKSRSVEFKKEAENLGIKILAEYAVIGRYDIVTIVEAPDIQSVMKLSVAQGKKGRTRVETLAAVPVTEFEEIIG